MSGRWPIDPINLRQKPRSRVPYPATASVPSLTVDSRVWANHAISAHENGHHNND